METGELGELWWLGLVFTARTMVRTVVRTVVRVRIRVRRARALPWRLLPRERVRGRERGGGHTPMLVRRCVRARRRRGGGDGGGGGRSGERVAAVRAGLRHDVGVAEPGAKLVRVGVRVR